MKTKIIIDTNFLLVPSQFKVDIFSEFERICSFDYTLCVMRGTQAELERIIKKPGEKQRNKLAARIGLSLIEIKRITEINLNDETNVDTKILKYCGQEKEGTKCIVATQDMALARRLKKLGIKTIRMRNKKYLQII